jgi:transcription elongation GreA/GreB family factor
MPKYVILLTAKDFNELRALTDEKYEELSNEVNEAEDESATGTSMESEADPDTVEQCEAYERITDALSNAQVLDEPETEKTEE